MEKYNLLQAILSTKKAGNMGREACLSLQKQRLQNLVAYAKEHSPYYRNLYASISQNNSHYPIYLRQTR